MISVLIPVYNAKKYLAESVESILNQSFNDIEILICDDGSNDGSKQIIEENFNSESRVNLIFNTTNIGYLKTINKLVSLARFPYLVFQDADDISHPKRLELQLSFLEKHKNIGLVGTNYARINSKGKIIGNHSVIEDDEEIKNRLQNTNPFQKPSIMFRKEITEDIGMYREEFLKLGNISEDLDWILRVSERYSLANINYKEPLYYYRAISTAMTKSFKNVDQLLGHDVAFYLAMQRKKNGKDSIDNGKLGEIFKYINKLKAPYNKDKSLFHVKKCNGFMYNKMTKEAIKEAFKALLSNPMKFRNYRLLQYCIRKTFLGI